MGKKKIYFKADASVEIGYGHFIRTLALADMLREEFDCTFFTSEPNDFQKGEVAKVCKLFPQAFSTSQEQFHHLLNGDEIVVLDNYFYTSEYQKQIKDKGCRLVCIDDIPEKHFYADVIINHSLSVSPDDYDCEPYTRVCTGADYLLIRKEFFAATKKEHVDCRNSIFICYGGSDEYDFTLKSCMLLRQWDNRHIIVVIGGGYDNRNSLKQYAKENNIAVYSNIDAYHMIHLMSSSLFAIVPASTTFFETCCARVPIITGYTVDNQKLIADSCERFKLGYNCGNFHEDFEQKLKDAYFKITQGKSSDYIRSQQLLINDSSTNLIKTFKELC